MDDTDERIPWVREAIDGAPLPIDFDVERPQTVSRPDEIDLCWCARPLLLGLPESVGGGSP
jgi:hypothetical protein